MDALRNKTVIIGRNPRGSNLLISVAGIKGTCAIGAEGSVPSSVSRCIPATSQGHARIEIGSDGRITITNMKAANVTWVDGVQVECKVVTLTSGVELGSGRFNINLPLVLDAAGRLLQSSGPEKAAHTPGAKEVFNIAHLRRVWNDYDREIAAINKRQQELGRRRMLPVMIGSFSGIASPVLAQSSMNSLFVTVPIAAISFGIYLLNYRKKDTSYEDRKAAGDRLTDRYVCPNPECNKFLGNISYKLLKKQYSMQCPYCKCHFIER